MREVVRNITYIADDGKEFDTQQKCAEYEKGLREQLEAKLKAEYKKIKQFVLPSGIFRWVTDEDLIVFEMKDASDFDVVKAYFEDVCDVYEYNACMPRTFPCVRVYAVDYMNGQIFDTGFTLDEIIEDAQELIDAIKSLNTREKGE